VDAVSISSSLGVSRAVAGVSTDAERESDISSTGVGGSDEEGVALLFSISCEVVKGTTAAFVGLEVTTASLLALLLSTGLGIATSEFSAPKTSFSSFTGWKADSGAIGSSVANQYHSLLLGQVN
jgi:hypothetical protein